MMLPCDVLRARLVAEQKLGRFLLPGEDVHHINEIKDDDRPDNLQVMLHAEHCRIPHSRRGTPKLTADEIRLIRQSYKLGAISQHDLAACYGVTQSHVNRIVKGNRWKHLLH